MSVYFIAGGIYHRRFFFYAIITIIMGKFLKIIFVSLAILAVVAGSGLFYLYETYKDELIFVDPVDGDTKIRLEEDEKIWIKKILKPVAELIYEKAAIHNPAGDALPDQLDDNIIKDIKKRVE